MRKLVVLVLCLSLISGCRANTVNVQPSETSDRYAGMVAAHLARELSYRHENKQLDELFYSKNLIADIEKVYEGKSSPDYYITDAIIRYYVSDWAEEPQMDPYPHAYIMYLEDIPVYLIDVETGTAPWSYSIYVLHNVQNVIGKGKYVLVNECGGGLYLTDNKAWAEIRSSWEDVFDEYLSKCQFRMNSREISLNKLELFVEFADSLSYTVELEDNIIQADDVEVIVKEINATQMFEAGEYQLIGPINCYRYGFCSFDNISVMPKSEKWFKLVKNEEVVSYVQYDTAQTEDPVRIHSERFSEEENQDIDSFFLNVDGIGIVAADSAWYTDKSSDYKDPVIEELVKRIQRRLTGEGYDSFSKTGIVIER